MSDITAQTFSAYGRKCGVVLAVLVFATLLMVGATYVPLPNRALSISMVLLFACFNAAMVVSYLMHLVTERKMILILLAFTVFFFAGLMGLTVWSAYDLPEALTY